MKPRGWLGCFLFHRAARTEVVVYDSFCLPNWRMWCRWCQRYR